MTTNPALPGGHGVVVKGVYEGASIVTSHHNTLAIGRHRHCPNHVIVTMKNVECPVLVCCNRPLVASVGQESPTGQFEKTTGLGHDFVTILIFIIVKMERLVHFGEWHSW